MSRTLSTTITSTTSTFSPLQPSLSSRSRSSSRTRRHHSPSNAKTCPNRRAIPGCKVHKHLKLIMASRRARCRSIRDSVHQWNKELAAQAPLLVQRWWGPLAMSLKSIEATLKWPIMGNYNRKLACSTSKNRATYLLVITNRRHSPRPYRDVRRAASP